MKQLMITGFVFVVGVIAVPIQATNINEDFSSLMVGNYAEGTDSASDIGAIYWGSGTAASIIDNESSPADPFGRSENQSMRIYSTGNGQLERAVYEGDAVSGVGRFSLDFRVAVGQLKMQLRNEGSAKTAIEIVADLRDGADNLQYFDGTDNVVFDQAIAVNMKYLLIINFDTDTDIFSGSINGVTLTTGGGTTTSFSFDESVDDIRRLDLQTYDAGQAESFVDNLYVVLGHTTAYLDENLNSLTVGNYVQGTDRASDLGAVYWSSGTTASIVDSGSSPADPFGGTENQSLRLYSAGNGQVERATYEGDAVSGVGRFSLDFRVAVGQLKMQLRNEGSAKTAVEIVANLRGGTDDLQYFDGTDNVVFDQAIAANTTYSIIITFNTDTETFSGIINGVTLTIGGGTTTSFSFDEAVDHISRLDLQTYDAGQSDSFVDNIYISAPIPPRGTLVVVQ